MHKSQLFYCPGQSYGISWNICSGRQMAGFEKCEICPYKEWQSKGLPGFNPYAGAFEPAPSPCGLARTTPDPRTDAVYRGTPRTFLPEDVGLEPKAEKKASLFKILYSLI